MRVNVNFTVDMDVRGESRGNLFTLCAASNLGEVRDFIKAEAANCLQDYLSSNGVPAQITFPAPLD